MAPATSDGWCQIEAPTFGCVSARFLEFGGAAASIVAEPETFARHSPVEPPLPEPEFMPAPQQQAGPEAARVRTAANVRARPNGTVIGKVPAGAMVAIVGCSGSWCRILVKSGGDAWVNQSLLERTGSSVIAAVPLGSQQSPASNRGSGQSGCGIPLGTATVAIANPTMPTLNVRERRGGRVLGTIPEGTRVSVVGECGSGRAAGIVADPARQSAGWCQIEAPTFGCVSDRYFVAGAVGPSPAAGVVAEPEVGSFPVEASFEEMWDSSVDGLAHRLRLTQAGDSVRGTFRGADGSFGRIEGLVSGGVLHFAWSQENGQVGSGRFQLSADGQGFDGSVSFTDDPDQADGSWTGWRR